MSTERDLLNQALNRVADLERVVGKQGEVASKLRLRVTALEGQLRQVRRAAEPRDVEECNQVSTPMLQPDKAARFSWREYPIDGPQPGDGSMCPCGCGYGASVG